MLLLNNNTYINKIHQPYILYILYIELYINKIHQPYIYKQKAQRVEQMEKHQLNFTDKNYIKNLKSKYFGLNKKVERPSSVPK